MNCNALSTLYHHNNRDVKVDGVSLSSENAMLKKQIQTLQTKMEAMEKSLKAVMDKLSEQPKPEPKPNPKPKGNPGVLAHCLLYTSPSPRD